METTSVAYKPDRDILVVKNRIRKKVKTAMRLLEKNDTAMI